MMFRNSFLTAALMAVVSACSSASAPKNETSDDLDLLKSRIESAIGKVNAEVGMAMICGDDTLSVNPTTAYPLMSVFKLHIAVALLQQADAGILSTDSVLTVAYSQLRPPHTAPCATTLRAKT